MPEERRSNTACEACGKSIDSEVLICPYCNDNHRLMRQLARTQNTEERQEARSPVTGRWRLWSVVLAIIVVAIIAVAYLAVTRPWAHASMTHDLEANYSTEGVDAVKLSGKVFNFGDKDGYATLSVNVTDSRGYSKNDTFDVGRVNSGGGFVEISKTYDWPGWYNGKSSSASYVLPITLTVNLTWQDV